MFGLPGRPGPPGPPGHKGEPGVPGEAPDYAFMAGKVTDYIKGWRFKRMNLYINVLNRKL